MRLLLGTVKEKNLELQTGLNLTYCNNVMLAFMMSVDLLSPIITPLR